MAADGATAAQKVAGTYYFKLTVPGAQAAKYFKECTGLESSNEVVESTSIDDNGMPLVQKLPGQVKWSDITLKRGVDSTKDLWTWRQQVLDGQIEQARQTCTITVQDSLHNQVAVYTCERAWPCKYSAPGMSAGANEVLVEEVVITHEGFKRT